MRNYHIKNRSKTAPLVEKSPWKKRAKLPKPSSDQAGPTVPPKDWYPQQGYDQEEQRTVRIETLGSSSESGKGSANKPKKGKRITAPPASYQSSTEQGPGRVPTPGPSQNPIRLDARSLIGKHFDNTPEGEEAQQIIDSPQWKQFRQSLVEATDGDDEILYLYEDHLLRQTPLAENSQAPSTSSGYYAQTPDSRSSRRAVYYEKPQTPVHAIDSLQVIAQNLKELASGTLIEEVVNPKVLEELREDEIRHLFQLAQHYCILALRAIERLDIPKVQYNPGRVYNPVFSSFLADKESKLVDYLFDPRNLTDPQLLNKVEDLRQCRATQRTHRNWLRRVAHGQRQT